MKREFSPQEPIDPHLIALLNQLTDVPQREPDLVDKNKHKFLSELESLPLPEKKPALLRQLLGGTGSPSNPENKKEKQTMKSNKLRLALGIVATLVVLVIVMFGGTTATVLASQNSIPGDTLYPIKTTLERTRLSLARSTETRIELQLEFAEFRLDEIEALIKEGRFQNIKPAITAFEGHIMKALEEINLLAEESPDQAVSLMASLTESLARYVAALTDMASRIPEPLRVDLEDTIINLGGAENTNNNGNFNSNFNSNYNENYNYNYNYNNNEDYNYNDNYNNNNNYNSNHNGD